MQPGPLGDVWLGPDTARCTIIEYASMTCSHCAASTRPPWRRSRSAGSIPARSASPCANSPRPRPTAASCWPGPTTRRATTPDHRHAVRPAAELGLRPEAPRRPRADDAPGRLLEGEVRGDPEGPDALRRGQRREGEGDDGFKVNATPTFFINGQKYQGEMTIEGMEKVIKPIVGRNGKRRSVRRKERHGLPPPPLRGMVAYEVGAAGRSPAERGSATLLQVAFLHEARGLLRKRRPPLPARLRSPPSPAEGGGSKPAPFFSGRPCPLWGGNRRPRAPRHPMKFTRLPHRRLQDLRRAERVPDRARADRGDRPERLRQVEPRRGPALGDGGELAQEHAGLRHGRRDLLRLGRAGGRTHAEVTLSPPSTTAPARRRRLLQRRRCAGGVAPHRPGRRPRPTGSMAARSGPATCS